MVSVTPRRREGHLKLNCVELSLKSCCSTAKDVFIHSGKIEEEKGGDFRKAEKPSTRMLTHFNHYPSDLWAKSSQMICIFILRINYSNMEVDYLEDGGLGCDANSSLACVNVMAKDRQITCLKVDPLWGKARIQFSATKPTFRWFTLLLKEPWIWIFSKFPWRVPVLNLRKL